jgi:hypothetical protein
MGMMIKEQRQLMGIKKKQKGRVDKISLLSHKALKKWP